MKPVDSSETIARISSALALGAAIGPLVVNKVWHAIGTKSTILFGCLIMSTSVIGLYIKYVYNVESRFSINYKCVQCLWFPHWNLSLSLPCSYGHTVLVASRFASGFTIGCIQVLMPLYVRDVSVPQNQQFSSNRLGHPSNVFHLQFILGVLTIYITGEYGESKMVFSG